MRQVDMSEDRSTTILMADDDPAHLVLAEAALAGAGFMVHTVADGEDAVAQFNDVKPDCVILDVNMPRMSGIEACQRIRQLAGTQLLPILMLTGRNDLPAISDAFKAGASDFAQKGINPRLLVERVRFLLRDLETQEELRASRSKLLLAQRIARVGHWELGTNGRTLHVSPMVGEILGIDTASLQKFEDFLKLLEPAQQDEVRRAFVTCATGNGRFSFDHSLRSGQGDPVWVHQEAELIQGGGPAHEGTVIVTLQDLTRLHRAEEAVRQLSYFDPASGLPNRQYLSEAATSVLQDPEGAAATAIATFRIHDFDRIVQAEGREFANRLLAQVATLLEHEHSNVSQGGTITWRTSPVSVCRSAESELAMLLRSRVSPSHLLGVVRTMLVSVCTQLRQDGTGYVPAISTGIAFADADATTAEQLLQNAHTASRQATVPRSCEVFSRQSQARVRRRLQLEAALRGALERRELSLTYQPRVATDTFKLTGVECRLHWQHPQLGAIAPDEFLPIAEAAGLSHEMMRWTLDEACRHLSGWRKFYEREFFVSVGISSIQLRDPEFAATVLATLECHELPASALELELRESSVFDAPAEERAVLNELRRSGIGIAIDGLGTGYSSLLQVRKFQFDCMKLDRTLMADLYTDVGAQGVAAAIIAMARGMRVRSVAEGIEDSAQVQMLSALGCDELQGTCISPPLRTRDFEAWLEDGGARDLARRQDREFLEALESVDPTVLDTRRFGGD
jgi:EAL domain-containing protein (putative c-di-GMP-specific phosphodiesterase class I)/DNA-binding response OmpR family regulator/GGDEF domain-containing protein